MNSCLRVTFIDFSEVYEKMPQKLLELKICNVKFDNKRIEWSLAFLTKGFQSAKKGLHLNSKGILSSVSRSLSSSSVLF